MTPITLSVTVLEKAKIEAEKEISAQRESETEARRNKTEAIGHNQLKIVHFYEIINHHQSEPRDVVLRCVIDDRRRRVTVSQHGQFTITMSSSKYLQRDRATPTV